MWKLDVNSQSYHVFNTTQPQLFKITVECTASFIFFARSFFSQTRIRHCGWFGWSNRLWIWNLDKNSQPNHIFNVTLPQYLWMSVENHCFHHFYFDSHWFFFSSRTRMRHCWPIWWVYRFETWTKTVTFIIFQHNSASLFLDHFGKSAASFIFWFQIFFFSNQNNGVKYCKRTKLLTKFPCATVDIRLASVQNLKLQGFSLQIAPGAMLHDLVPWFELP